VGIFAKGEKWVMHHDLVELEQAPVIHGLLAYAIVAVYGTIITN